jgi:hypothetical protein
MVQDLDQGEFAMTKCTKDWAEKRADLSDVALAHLVLSVGRDSEVGAVVRTRPCLGARLEPTHNYSVDILIPCETVNPFGSLAPPNGD